MRGSKRHDTDRIEVAYGQRAGGAPARSDWNWAGRSVSDLGSLLKFGQLEQDRGEDHAASAKGALFVIPGGQTTPVLKVVGGPFNDVAVLVVAGMERDGSAAASASGLRSARSCREARGLLR